MITVHLLFLVLVMSFLSGKAQLSRVMRQLLLAVGRCRYAQGKQKQEDAPGAYCSQPAPSSEVLAIMKH